MNSLTQKTQSPITMKRLVVALIATLVLTLAATPVFAHRRPVVAPTITSPTKGAVVRGDVQLTWTAVKDVTDYRVRVTAHVSRRRSVTTETTVKGATSAKLVLPEKSYSVRVVGLRAGSRRTTAWSKTVYFSVAGVTSPTNPPVTTTRPATTTTRPVTTTTVKPTTTVAPTVPTTTVPPIIRDEDLIQPEILIDGVDVPVTVATTTTVAPTTTRAPSTTVAPTTTAPSNNGDVQVPAALRANGKAWSLKFSEDFSATSLDTSKWTPCFSWASNTTDCSYSFNGGKERYSPSQVRLSGGTAKLVAEPGTSSGGFTYKSGLISTTNAIGGNNPLYSFKYGYVEGRMKLPSTRGFFSAFWMLPTDRSYAYQSEIDIFETLGGDNTVYMHAHYDGRGSSYTPGGNGACAQFDYSKDFHTYGVDWQANYVAWYIDGVKCGQYNGAVSDQPMEIILNLMIDVQWQKNVGLTLQNPSAVGTLEVDYIKVWQ